METPGFSTNWLEIKRIFNVQSLRPLPFFNFLSMACKFVWIDCKSTCNISNCRCMHKVFRKHNGLSCLHMRWGGYRPAFALTIEVNKYNPECTRAVLHIYEGFTWYIITIIVPGFPYFSCVSFRTGSWTVDTALLLHQCITMNTYCINYITSRS